MTEKVSLFTAPDSYSPNFLKKSFKYVLIDRKSKYTVTGGTVRSKEEIKERMKSLCKEKEFKKATHNTYARRIQRDDGGVIEGKNDDGESGAGNCILRELQRKNAINMILVVTRYYGGVHLHADRFKNVIQASKIFFEKI